MRKHKILLADDDEEVFYLELQFLKEMGHEVIHVYDVPSAIETYHQQGPFTLVLSDIEMGHKGNGFDLIEKIKPIHPGIILLHSDNKYMVEKAQQQGIVAFLKPSTQLHFIDLFTSAEKSASE